MTGIFFHKFKWRSWQDIQRRCLDSTQDVSNNQLMEEASAGEFYIYRAYSKD